MSNFLDLVKKRASCRAYKNDPVPKDLIDRILEATMEAPSACNRQPWRLAVVTNSALRAEIVNKGFIPGIQMRWAADAPVLLVLGIEKSFITHKVAPAISGVDYPLLDLGIAGEHAVLQATESGLGTCWIGWIKPKEVRRIVEWPNNITPQAIITIGWPANTVERKTSRLPPGDIIKSC
jgi:nitroreductase